VDFTRPAALPVNVTLRHIRVECIDDVAATAVETSVYRRPDRIYV
jgi:hypothetical protein